MIEWAKPQIEKVIKDKEKQKQYIEILKEFKEEKRDILSIFNLFIRYDFSKEDYYRICRLLTWKPIIPLTGAEEEWNTIKDEICFYDSCESRNNDKDFYKVKT